MGNIEVFESWRIARELFPILFIYVLKGQGATKSKALERKKQCKITKRNKKKKKGQRRREKMQKGVAGDLAGVLFR